ncbi:Ig-like domain-containing protein [Corynebacterium sp. ES2715-CONJ3]|uniref:Ig-like domain-containing protein n=1 Tax=Corynebacterium sp. ES2715-CONJ3 TaxID=2974028 RepID=UPI0021682C7C|nr:Ig-like domain-containing protein [Corynebacterium sp. ES2715-CONJ3]MCS4492287.1 Ig-like domain-containing protein [Corynebacterium sp. ES2715-CONJ3]
MKNLIKLVSAVAAPTLALSALSVPLAPAAGAKTQTVAVPFKCDLNTVGLPGIAQSSAHAISSGYSFSLSVEAPEAVLKGDTFSYTVKPGFVGAKMKSQQSGATISIRAMEQGRLEILKPQNANVVNVSLSGGDAGLEKHESNQSIRIDKGVHSDSLQAGDQQALKKAVQRAGWLGSENGNQIGFNVPEVSYEVTATELGDIDFKFPRPAQDKHPYPGDGPFFTFLMEANLSHPFLGSNDFVGLMRCNIDTNNALPTVKVLDPAEVGKNVESLEITPTPAQGFAKETSEVVFSAKDASGNGVANELITTVIDGVEDTGLTDNTGRYSRSFTPEAPGTVTISASIGTRHEKTIEYQVGEASGSVLSEISGTLECSTTYSSGDASGQRYVTRGLDGTHGSGAGVKIERNFAFTANIQHPEAVRLGSQFDYQLLNPTLKAPAETSGSKAREKLTSSAWNRGRFAVQLPRNAEVGDPVKKGDLPGEITVNNNAVTMALETTDDVDTSDLAAISSNSTGGITSMTEGDDLVLRFPSVSLPVTANQEGKIAFAFPQGPGFAPEDTLISFADVGAFLAPGFFFDSTYPVAGVVRCHPTTSMELPSVSVLPALESLDISGPARIEVGSTAEFAVTVRDSQGPAVGERVEINYGDTTIAGRTDDQGIYRFTVDTAEIGTLTVTATATMLTKATTLEVISDQPNEDPEDSEPSSSTPTVTKDSWIWVLISMFSTILAGSLGLLIFSHLLPFA